VVESRNNRVVQLAIDGTFVRVFCGKECAFRHSGSRSKSADGEFKHPQGIAVLPSGEVAVADSFDHRVQMFDSQLFRSQAASFYFVPLLGGCCYHCSHCDT
jgi:hypothetical protein